MELDATYGECLPLQRSASEAEMSVMPRSLQILNEETAAGLKAYMESAHSLYLPRVMHATTPILWLVDDKGGIRFALEEVLARDTGSTTHILPRGGPPLRETDIRLGHPSLLDPVNPGATKSARIGGEIIYDPIPQSSDAWVLTNNSGRFGKRPHITRAHLDNVREAFKRFDISLRAYFIYSS
jgi:hypothetical protein